MNSEIDPKLNTGHMDIDVYWKLFALTKVENRAQCTVSENTGSGAQVSVNIYSNN